MKNLIIVLSFICVANFSFSQDILDGTPRDGVYDKDIRDGGFKITNMLEKLM